MKSQRSQIIMLVGLLVVWAISWRIVREIMADLPHLTTPELLDLGRNAFAQA